MANIQELMRQCAGCPTFEEMMRDGTEQVIADVTKFRKGETGLDTLDQDNVSGVGDSFSMLSGSSKAKRDKQVNACLNCRNITQLSNDDKKRVAGAKAWFGY